MICLTTMAFLSIFAKKNKFNFKQMTSLLRFRIIFTFSFLIVFLFTAMAQNKNNDLVITPGTLTFKVKTITNNTMFSPKNVLAIWIKDAQGNFVVSLKVMAKDQKSNLVKWNASSLENTVDATTGATLTSHQSHTVTWNGKNAAGVEMQDGIYQIWVEYTSNNSASENKPGPFMTLDFTKGIDSQHVAPANQTYFQNIVADWVPLNTGMDDFSKAGAGVKIYPNPFHDKVNIQLVCSKPSQTHITVYDVSGKKVAELLSGSVGAGTRKITWNGTSDDGKKLINGEYFIQTKVNGFTQTQKVLLNR